jgi:RNA recognition motif-containing protein
MVDAWLDSANRHSGRGIVIFASPEEAAEAINEFNGKEMLGRTVRFTLDTHGGVYDRTIADREEIPVAEPKAPAARKPRASKPRDSKPRDSKPRTRQSTRVSLRGAPTMSYEEWPAGGHATFSNLPFVTSPAEFAHAMADAGVAPRCVDIWTSVRNGADNSTGSGVAIFRSAAEAADFVEKFNNADFMGRTLVAAVGPAGEVRASSKRSRSGPYYLPTVAYPEVGKGQALFARNLPYSLTSEELAASFEGYDVLVADMWKSRRGRPAGFGVVILGSAEQATDAIAKLDGVDVAGRAMRLALDKEDGHYADLPRAN